jgi:TonB family protein
MAHTAILDQHDPFGRPLMASVVLHSTVIVTAALGSWLGSPVSSWGERNSTGGAVAVSPVRGIPMAARTGQVNPVANDTESRVPQPPQKARPRARVPAEDPNAVAIKSPREKKRASEIAASNQKFRATEDQPNQLYSSAGQAMVSPMIGRTGSGGVGVGMGSPLGDRFGAYATELQRRIAEKWRTNDVDPRLRTAPRVSVTFTVLRDGTIREIKVKQSSGNAVLDLSAQRAVYDVGRLAPLPLAYGRDEAQVEILFELKR